MKFLGKSKAYHYKDKVIGVCPTLNEKLYMIGSVNPTGSYTRMKAKALPICSSIEIAQENLDKYAVKNGLVEVAENALRGKEECVRDD